MDKTIRFWDRLAHRYARQAIADPQAYEYKLRQTRLGLEPTMRVLEFGCGTGSTALAHAPYVAHILALDFSPVMVEIARAKAAEAGVGNVTFECCTLDQMPPHQGSFDAVFGFSILHLLAQRTEALAQVQRLLKPGGRFYSSTPCIADRFKPLKWVAPLGKALGLLPTLRVFSAEQLSQDMQQAGFTIEQRWQPGPGKAVFMVARKV